MKTLFWIMLMSTLCANAQAQRDKYHATFMHEGPNTDSVDIAYLNLGANRLLYTELRKFIRDKTDSSALFKSGFGFIKVGSLDLAPRVPVLAQELDKYAKRITVTFSMEMTAHPLLDKYSLTRYPTYYSIVDGRLVLLYDKVVEWYARPVYTSKSRRKIAGLVNDAMKKALDPDFVFYNPLQKIASTLTKEERQKMSAEAILEKASLTLNESRRVIQYFDGSIAYTY